MSYAFGIAREAIGRAAAGPVQDRETIFLGSGTTTLEVARNLRGKRNLTILTNTFNVATLLAEQPDMIMVVTGGLLRCSELSLVGHVAENVLSELHADKVIMGMRAIDIEHGLTSDYLPETETDRVIVRSAPQLIMVADHSKLGKVSTALVGPITALDALVADAGARPQFVSALREMGLGVIIA